MADVDWDLHAVVRGCTTTSSTPNNNTSYDFFGGDVSSSSSSVHGSEQVGHFFSLPDPFEATNGIGDLHELFYQPFAPKSHDLPLYFSQLSPISSLSSITISEEQLQPKQSLTSTAKPPSKRRKNQLKKICQVPTEALSSDVWAWRKYGQKPIKGSPYPRGYYRCSSSKGCLARKQVERNRSDPRMFIVTYTAEHNHPAPTHRNSLAGSTRQKNPSTTPPIVSAAAEGDKSSSPAKPTCSSPATSIDDEVLAQSANSEGREEKDVTEDVDDDEFGGFSDMDISDDFFVGLEGLGGPATGDSFYDQFPANFGLLSLANNAATAAGNV